MRENKVLTQERLYFPGDILYEAMSNPDRFWENHKNTINRIFGNRLSSINKAGGVILIPAHNEGGKKDEEGKIRGGHLMACLYGITTSLENLMKTLFPLSSLGIVIIDHNSDKDDITPELLKDLPGVTRIVFNNENLKGFTYSLQLGLRLAHHYKNLSYIIVIDADTVIPPNGLSTIINALSGDKEVVVFSRMYINPQGSTFLERRIPQLYGEIKILAEGLLRRHKLVTGCMGLSRKALELITPVCDGRIVTDGVIQKIIENAGFRIHLLPEIAYSDGSKYSSFKALEEVFRFKWKIPLGYPFTINDHIRYLLIEVPRYFPLFEELLNSCLPNMKTLRETYWKLNLEQKKGLLELLQDLYDKYNLKCKQIFLNSLDQFIRG